MYFAKDDLMIELKALTPHLRRRFRQRAKHNLDRILKQIRELKKKHGSVKSFPWADDPDLYLNYMKLNDKLTNINWKLTLIDMVLKELNAKVIRYVNGDIVQYGSMDYLILSLATNQ